ncbi:MAG: DUF423 domain-containing protein [Proteobacteria bacterium]|nr:DUF423 domain-containing protein [Pseudomonadota bacterium]
MRWLNICAALSGALALAALAGRHARPDIELSTLMLAAIAQLSAAAAGLAIANRSGRLNAIAGAVILAGAFIFSGEIYFGAYTGNHSLIMLAPVGGTLMILGWIVLAFANPADT